MVCGEFGDTDGDGTTERRCVAASPFEECTEIFDAED